MELIQVSDKVTEALFLKASVEVNRNTPHYIRPLDKDIRMVFDPAQNKAFRQGECARWVLKDGEGKLIGRIAAFVNKKYRSKGDKGPVGGMGFFDCIQHQDAADMLFDVAKHWLLQRGMTAMDGPINFGERDRWWGLVVKGFQEPLYGMNFNPPYYQELVENYGFRPFFHQVCFGMDAKKPMSEKLLKRHARVAADPTYSAKHIRKDQLEKFAEDFTEIYNKAWAGHGGMKELRKEQVVVMFKTMKPVMDERIIWFAYHNDRPIALFVNLPDLNQWFKHLNGQFNLLAKLKFLWVKATKPCRKLTGIVFGIIPEYQAKGVDAYIIVETAKVVQPETPYTEYEMQWIGDFNPKMINVAEKLPDSFRTRELITYRYNFDRTQPFERHPIL